MTLSILDILSILGGVGFVVAGYLAILELRDYYHRLRLLITYLDCQPTGNETSLVLFRLSFVNPASQGRTVCGIDVTSMMPEIPRIELNTVTDSNLQTVTYSLPNVSRQLPLDETLLFPLDIPPHQSLSRWTAIAVSYHGIAPISGTHIRIEATVPAGMGRWKQTGKNQRGYLGIKKRILAKAGIFLFPAKEQSTTIDIYHELQFPNP